MSYFTVGIILPKGMAALKAGQAVYDHITQVMAPYHEELEDVENPKWDWYRVGGRWDGWVCDNKKQSENGFNFDTKHETIENNHALTDEMIRKDKIPFALVTPDGKWNEKGKMGWWAVVSDENSNWPKDAKELLGEFAGHQVVILDAHI